MPEKKKEDWLESILNLGSKATQEPQGETFVVRSMRYQRVFGTPDGQKVLWDLINQTYLFFPFEQENAGSYKKEGRREMGLYILALMGFTPNPNSLRRLAVSLANVSMEEESNA